MPSDQRFVKTYSQASFFDIIEIWVDRLTGVNYLFRKDGHGAGLTPLLNRDGTPVVTSVPREE